MLKSPVWGGAHRTEKRILGGGGHHTYFLEGGTIGMGGHRTYNIKIYIVITYLLSVPGKFSNVIILSTGCIIYSLSDPILCVTP